jgi:hypothetical protein
VGGCCVGVWEWGGAAGRRGGCGWLSLPLPGAQLRVLCIAGGSKPHPKQHLLTQQCPPLPPAEPLIAGKVKPRPVLSDIASAYRQLWGVVQLPAVWRLSLLLVTYRLGVMVAESAASLKLLDKGVAKETLAFLVLFQFPVELVSALIAGR